MTNLVPFLFICLFAGWPGHHRAHTHMQTPHRKVSWLWDSEDLLDLGQQYM